MRELAFLLYEPKNLRMSPMSLSLNRLKDAGYSVHRVEYWNPFSKRRVDAFGFADILAFKVGTVGTVYVQTTTKAHMNDRIAKIRSIPEAGIALASGNRIVVHGWSKRGPRGKRKVWECDEVWL